MRRQLRSSAVALAVGAAMSFIFSVQAQTYPAKPVRVVVPFPPGGISDVLSRVMAAHLTNAMGQQAATRHPEGAA